jgi:hypothetical protein
MGFEETFCTLAVVVMILIYWDFMILRSKVQKQHKALVEMSKVVLYLSGANLARTKGVKNDPIRNDHVPETRSVAPGK